MYTVVITATDPSGASGNATVTVTIKDANEAAEFTDDAKADANVTLYIDENETVLAPLVTALIWRCARMRPTPTLTTDATDSNTAPDVYTATDEDRATDAVLLR